MSGPENQCIWLLIRLSGSPREIADAAQMNADNKNNGRQLDEKGIQSAQAIGNALHHLSSRIHGAL
jgi:hypothetical protein